MKNFDLGHFMFRSLNCCALIIKCNGLEMQLLVTFVHARMQRQKTLFLLLDFCLDKISSIACFIFVIVCFSLCWSVTIRR